MLRTLFDPVARFMGYMPSGSNPEGTPGELSVATESASIQPSRAHLRHEADFVARDWITAVVTPEQINFS